MQNTSLHNKTNHYQSQEDQPVVGRGRAGQEGHDDFSSKQHGQDDDGPIEKGSYQDQPDDAAVDRQDTVFNLFH